jgi:zinc transporter 1/2/3
VSLTLESESESTHTATEESEHDHEAEHDHDHASGTSAESSGEIAEVTDCHPHEDVLYCMADGEEWEVTTEVDAANAPESYSGCHSHGADELHCSEGDVEVSLLRAGAEATSHEESSSSSSSSAAAGEAVDCHSHAGVE